MKNKNQGNTDRALAFAIVFVLLALPSCHQVNNGQILVKTTPTNTIVFEGTLVKLGSDPGFDSGALAVYRLAKYRVDKVCKGKYDGSEIVVDHLILSRKEFDGINVNDRVCVTVRVSNKIIARWDSEGIRNSTDDVKNFYEAQEQIKLIDGRPTCCRR